MNVPLTKLVRIISVSIYNVLYYKFFANNLRKICQDTKSFVYCIILIWFEKFLFLVTKLVRMISISIDTVIYDKLIVKNLRKIRTSLKT